MSPLPTPLLSEEIHIAPYRAKNCNRMKILKTLALLKLWKEKYKWTMNSENIYVLIKYCKENYYKTLVLAKRENANAPESSGNSNPTRTLKRKAY